MGQADIREKLLFTFAMLVVFRFTANLPVPGVNPLALDRIFQPFQRLHGRAAYEGSGIGLAVCDKIARRHGGAITARSRLGEGTTFLVTLPEESAQS